MTDDKTPADRTPSLRDRMKPVEFLGIAAVLALFVGLIVLMATREPVLAIVFFGIAFIVTLVVLAMFALGFKPDDEERRDLAELNGEQPQLPDGTDSGTTGPDGRRPPRNPHD
ncbi:hypothetical protein ACO2Q7_10130 [Rathayibacter sp. KR2-224]|uniref:hypothetical protein n=1 Tax=Rathayibacter sp. KR2-224 TaxID=3400913 RepID=UPI003C0AED06